ncbi:hypothetical protein Efla_000675 [Eimeria flavescens]
MEREGREAPCKWGWLPAACRVADANTADYCGVRTPLQHTQNDQQLDSAELQQLGRPCMRAFLRPQLAQQQHHQQQQQQLGQTRRRQKMSEPSGHSPVAETLAAATGSAAATARGGTARSNSWRPGAFKEGIKSFLGFASRLKYRNVSPQFAAAVIQGGTLCRTLWPLLPPLLLLQYIRQVISAELCLPFVCLSVCGCPSIYAWLCLSVDSEMLSVEGLTAAAAAAAAERGDSRESVPVYSFFDSRKPGWTGHWRLQQDLAVISERVNKS